MMNHDDTGELEDMGHLPHASTVEAMAGYGISANDIARVLKIDPEVLTVSFADELATGHIKANAKVAESLYRMATREGREAVTAAIFWLKARARWKEVPVHQHGGVAGEPLQINVIKRIAVDPPARDAATIPQGDIEAPTTAHPHELISVVTGVPRR